MMRSEYTANLMMGEKSELQLQAERNMRTRAKVAKIRAELASKKQARKWWEVWK
jgi:hypothetical protein